MNRIQTIALLFSCALLTGCEALSKGKFMQWDDTKGLSIALVSLHIDGLEDQGNTPRAQELTTAMLVAAEDILATKFSVTPAVKFIGEASYRARATATPVDDTVSPLVNKATLATFTTDSGLIRKAQIPNQTASHLAEDLGVKYVAVVHTKWHAKKYQSGDVLRKQADGSYDLNSEEMGMKTFRNGSYANTTLTIFDTLGWSVISEHRIGNGGSLPMVATAAIVLANDDHRRSILRAFKRSIANVVDEVQPTRSSIELRPK